MPKIHFLINITICIIIILFNCIISNPSYEDYSSVYLNKIRIGSQSKEIALILNTIISKSILFTNSKRPYSEEIQKKRKSDVLIDKVTIEGEVISSYPFNLQIDETKLNDKNIQGVFGLGIDNQNSSDLVDILFENQVISSKIIEFSLEEDKNNKKFDLNLNPNKDEFTYCELSSKKNYDEEDYYYESWICELSHMVIGSTKAELVWNKTIEVRGEVAFDSRTKYIYIPKDFMKYYSDLWDINSVDCKILTDSNTREKYYSCVKDMENKINSMHSIYFIIGGYGYRLKAQNLFENDGKNINCLIRFYNNDNNLWVLGAPFLREYATILDYNHTKIGFKGGDILDFKKDYEKWGEEVAEKEMDLFKNYSWEKIVMIIGVIVGSLIIICIIFSCYRNCRKATGPQYHIELKEQYDKKEFYH